MENIFLYLIFLIIGLFISNRLINICGCKDIIEGVCEDLRPGQGQYCQWSEEQCKTKASQNDYNNNFLCLPNRNMFLQTDYFINPEISGDYFDDPMCNIENTTLPAKCFDGKVGSEWRSSRCCVEPPPPAPPSPPPPPGFETCNEQDNEQSLYYPSDSEFPELIREALPDEGPYCSGIRIKTTNDNKGYCKFQPWAIGGHGQRTRYIEQDEWDRMDDYYKQTSEALIRSSYDYCYSRKTQEDCITAHTHLDPEWYPTRDEFCLWTPGYEEDNNETCESITNVNDCRAQPICFWGIPYDGDDSRITDTNYGQRRILSGPDLREAECGWKERKKRFN
uniref:Uncharacterized protein n=1 Tax=viral metagenome TaxID=1070528 RepID=A0A6C0C508_9ZZZZ